MGYYCNKCEKPITEEVYGYSYDKFHKVLCIEHQPKSYKVNKPIYHHKATPEAKRLYCALKAAGFSVELEKKDGYKTIDIAITSLKINIEVDGSHHNLNPKQALADLKRTYYSFLKGYITLRIPNSLIRDHFDETVEYLCDFLDASEEQREGEGY